MPEPSAPGRGLITGKDQTRFQLWEYIDADRRGSLYSTERRQKVATRQ